MKLKTVIGSLVAVGLVSASAFAADATNAKSGQSMKNQNVSTKTTVKHQHHHHHHHSTTAPVTATPKATPTVAAPATTALRVSRSKITPTTKGQIINANEDNAFADPINAIMSNTWLEHTRITGQIDVDTAFARQVDGSTRKSNLRSGIGLGTADLYLDTDLGDWIHGHVALDGEATGNNDVANNGSAENKFSPGFYTFAGFDNVEIKLNEATAELANFDKSPLWLRVGLQTLNFGSVIHDPLIASLPQLIEEINTTAIVGGYTMDAANGAVVSMDGYLYNGYRQYDTANNTESNIVPGWGLDVSYTKLSQPLDFNVHTGLIGNLSDTNLLRDARVISATNPNPNNQFPSFDPRKNIPVEALSLDAQMTFAKQDDRSVNLYSNTVVALRQYDVANLPNGHDTENTGARPFATDLEGGYKFDTLIHGQHKSEAVIGGELTNDVAALQLPRARLLAFYRINLLSKDNAYADNFYAKVEYNHDFTYWNGFRKGPQTVVNNKVDDNVFVLRLGALI